MEDLELLEKIAETCHEVNRSYCQGHGDSSQLPWKDSPEWQKTSAMNGVRYHRSNPESTPSDSHMSWLKEKTEQGWKYGKIKDADKKEHPCFVSYEELPEQQKAKDLLFLTVVRSFE